MQSSFPWSVVEESLLGGTGSEAAVPCMFHDALMLDLVAGHPPISGHDYRRAVDRRTIRALSSFQTRELAIAVVELAGRHVGTLGSIVPTGRAFSTMAHVSIRYQSGSIVSLSVESGLVGHLTGSGVRVVPGRVPCLGGVVFEAAADRTNLLEGDVADTYWARAWRLPPRLARLAVQLMAGISPKTISLRSGLSLRSVRTYTEELLARAKVHSRNELAIAALRVGSVPE